MKVKRNDMVLFNVIEDGVYGLLNPLTRNLHRINETGKFIWEACEEEKDTDEIVQMVQVKFDIDREVAHKDVEEFVDRMIEFQLFEEV